jgi:hypothetical protein
MPKELGFLNHFDTHSKSRAKFDHSDESSSTWWAPAFLTNDVHMPDVKGVTFGGGGMGT